MGAAHRAPPEPIRDVHTMIATIVLFASLGLDTLAVAVGFGLSGLPRSRWLRLALTLAAFESGMPIVGLLVGQRLGPALGALATYLAAGLLVVIGLLAIREARADARRANQPSRPPEAEARPLLLTGLSVGLDELAVGFSLGVLGVSLGPALGYIAVQALALTGVGLLLGERLGARLGARAELVSGVVLAALGLGLFLNEAIGGALR